MAYKHTNKWGCGRARAANAALYEAAKRRVLTVFADVETFADAKARFASNFTTDLSKKRFCVRRGTKETGGKFVVQYHIPGPGAALDEHVFG